MTGITHPSQKQFTLNWRQLIVHGFVGWLFPVSLNVWFSVRLLGEPAYCFPPPSTAFETFTRYVLAIAGPLLALLLTASLSRKNNWPIASTLLGVVLATLYRYFCPDFPVLDFITFSIGSNIIPLEIAFLLSGAVLMASGFLLVYSKPAIAFIEAGHSPDKQATVPPITTDQ